MAKNAKRLYAVSDATDRGIDSLFLWTIRNTKALAVEAYDKEFARYGETFASNRRGLHVVELEVTIVREA